VNDDTGAFDVAQKAITQASTVTRAFDQAGDVGRDNTLLTTFDDTE
jgi:hypothetical protein